MNHFENPPSRLLWVGNVSSDMSDTLLKHVFETYGTVDSVAAYPQRNYAFVEFKELEEATAAKAALQGKVVSGQALRIEFGKPAKPSRHLWIWGVGETITKEQLETEFKKFGAVEDFKMLRDRKCALAEYKKLDDARAALKGLNKKFIGGEELRVDFLRSQPLKRVSVEMEANFPYVTEEKRSKEGLPSDTLWISYPASVRVDEERLRRAFILFGEVENIKNYPDRNYCFVQFRNADEASRAKEGLQGRLFNDPRVQIRFSNNEAGFGGTLKGDRGFVPPLHHSEGLLHPGLIGPRAPLTAVERFGPTIPNMAINFPGKPFALHHDIRGSDSKIVLGRQVGVIPPTGFGISPLAKGRVLDVLPPFEGAQGRVAKPEVNFGSARPVVDGHFMHNDYTQREFKKPKIAMPNAAGALERSSMSDVHLLGRESQRGYPYGKGGSEVSPFTSFGAHAGPSYVSAVQSGVDVMGQCTGKPLPSSGNMEKLQGFGMTNDKWKWQGAIAKAGTFVCRARSFPVGKGIGTCPPDVVNCVARTALDTLAEHFHKAVDFGAIVFVPDGDSESACYQDFVHYLGDKQRAGVAKLSDGTTLFLVPPSQFSERVLKLPGDCLFGLVIKSPQVASLPPSYQQQHALLPDHNGLQHLSQPQPKSTSDDVISKTSSDSVGNWNASLMSSIAPLSQSAHLSMTPELVASLNSLLPVQRYDQNNGSNTPGVTSDAGLMGAVQVKGLGQAAGTNKTAEVSPHNEMFFAQTPWSASMVAFDRINNHFEMPQEQANMMLPNSRSFTEAQGLLGQVSGTSELNLRSSGGAPELPTKDLNQLTSLLSQRPQPFATQQHAQYVQEQVTLNPQSQLQSKTQAVLSDSLLGQPSLGQGLRHDGLISTQNAGVGPSTESNLAQGDGEVGERNNRFQATLQLAAALLQRMHNPGRSQDTSPLQ